MNFYLNSFVLGIVEGITEFLPISSTAHLILASHFLHMPQSTLQKFFEVFIQSGAIIAVIIMYFKKLWQEKIQFNILLSFIPTAVVGFLLYKVIKGVFFASNLLIIIALFVGGIIFLILEILIKKNKIKLTKSIESINFKQALLIGLLQSLAILPGISRAGAVMVAMMFMGYKRDESAVYSFLLAIPTVLAASVFDLYKVRGLISFYTSDTTYLFIGLITAFITAYISVKWLISYLKKNSLSPFGIYRIALAIILVIVFKKHLLK